MTYNFSCPACGYAMQAPATCENPACLDNPSHSPTWKATLVERREQERLKEAEYQEMVAKKTRLRKAGFHVF